MVYFPFRIVYGIWMVHVTPKVNQTILSNLQSMFNDLPIVKRCTWCMVFMLWCMLYGFVVIYVRMSTPKVYTMTAFVLAGNFIVLSVLLK